MKDGYWKIEITTYCNENLTSLKVSKKLKWISPNYDQGGAAQVNYSAQKETTQVHSERRVLQTKSSNEPW